MPSLVMRVIERKQLGILFKDLIEDIKEQRVSVSFVDNKDLIINGEILEEKMQEILDIYNICSVCI